MNLKSEANQRWVIGISGASGTVYARRLLQALIATYSNLSIDVVVSDSALRVMREEENLSSSVGKLRAEDFIGEPCSRITVHSNRNIGASIASGSFPLSGMAIVPCSMKTLAGIANGYCDNLLLRAADVTLKESRPLVLVPRETPLSAIHLENMLRLARLGVRIVPAMPGFYHQPKSIEDLIDMMVMRIADQMNLRLNLATRWKMPDEERSDPAIADHKG